MRNTISSIIHIFLILLFNSLLKNSIYLSLQPNLFFYVSQSPTISSHLILSRSLSLCWLPPFLPYLIFLCIQYFSAGDRYAYEASRSLEGLKKHLNCSLSRSSPAIVEQLTRWDNLLFCTILSFSFFSVSIICSHLLCSPFLSPPPPLSIYLLFSSFKFPLLFFLIYPSQSFIWIYV